MDTFKTIFKKSFLEGFSNYEIGETTIVLTLVFTALIALYIFFVYRIITRKSFYSKTFNISLFAIAVITAAIILTIQTNLVISLGMVGALSIVRFRTAIKDPMDLVFLFWAISVGIICGAGHAEIAIIVSFGLTVGVLVLDHIPDAKGSMLLIINCSDIQMESKITDQVKEFCKYYKVRARNMVPDKLELTYEVRTSNGDNLVQGLSKIDNITSVALISHDGEVTF